MLPDLNIPSRNTSTRARPQRCLPPDGNVRPDKGPEAFLKYLLLSCVQRHPLSMTGAASSHQLCPWLLLLLHGNPLLQQPPDSLQGFLCARAAPELVVKEAAGVCAWHKLGQAERVVPRVGACPTDHAHSLQPCSSTQCPSRQLPNSLVVILEEAGFGFYITIHPCCLYFQSSEF